MKQINLTSYRLNDLSELDTYKQKMGESEFFRYREKVFKQLSQIKSGETFYFTRYVKPDNLPLFIKLCCSYIIEHPNCELTNDYDGFKRL